METAPCWVSMCWARSYPRSPNRDSSSSRCWDTRPARACALAGLPAATAAAAAALNRFDADGGGGPDTEPGEGRFAGERPTVGGEEKSWEIW